MEEFLRIKREREKKRVNNLNRKEDDERLRAIVLSVLIEASGFSRLLESTRCSFRWISFFRTGHEQRRRRPRAFDFRFAELNCTATVVRETVLVCTVFKTPLRAVNDCWKKGFLFFSLLSIPPENDVDVSNWNVSRCEQRAEQPSEEKKSSSSSTVVRNEIFRTDRRERGNFSFLIIFYTNTVSLYWERERERDLVKSIYINRYLIYLLLVFSLYAYWKENKRN